jgi:hypothetical protein
MAFGEKPFMTPKTLGVIIVVVLAALVYFRLADELIPSRSSMGSPAHLHRRWIQGSSVVAFVHLRQGDEDAPSRVREDGASTSLRQSPREPVTGTERPIDRFPFWCRTGGIRSVSRLAEI